MKSLAQSRSQFPSWVSERRFAKVPWLLAVGLLVAAFMLSTNAAMATSHWVPLFEDDFEAGAGAWDLDPGWSVVDESGNQVLEGQGHNWAYLPAGEGWTDYRFVSQVKLVEDSVHINMRVNETGRYFFNFHSGGVHLSKQLWDPSVFTPLQFEDFPVSLNEWHEVEVIVEGDHIQIAVDGSPTIDYVDPDPLLYGTIAFESLPGDPGEGAPPSIIRVDNVYVEGEEPPPGGPVLDVTPQEAENPVGTEHTIGVTAVGEDGERIIGALVDFEILSGPNLGEQSDPGECFPNDDCTTDEGGKVQWTYASNGEPGTDWIWITVWCLDKGGDPFVCLEGEAAKHWFEPEVCPKEPGTRSMGFYKNHEDIVLQALEIGGQPEQFEDTMKLLWKNQTEKGKQQVLILDRANEVLKLNMFLFGIGPCTVEQLGLDPEALGLHGDEVDLTVEEIRGQAKGMLHDVDPDGTRDFGKEPLTDKEKSKLTDIYVIIDAINNSNTEVPLPEPPAKD